MARYCACACASVARNGHNVAHKFSNTADAETLDTGGLCVRVCVRMCELKHHAKRREKGGHSPSGVSVVTMQCYVAADLTSSSSLNVSRTIASGSSPSKRQPCNGMGCEVG